MRSYYFNKFRIFLIPVFIASFLYIFSIANIAKAETNASFSIIVPRNGDLISGCAYEADIRLNTGTNNSNAADIIINYDPSKIEILAPNGSEAKALRTKYGSREYVYQGYLGNQVDELNGVIRLTGVTWEGSFRGEGLFANILFRPKQGAVNGNFSISFDAASPTASLDSNIAITETSLDALGAVNNAEFTFRSGECTLSPNTPEPVNPDEDIDPNKAEESPPDIIFLTPLQFDRLNQNRISFRITDDLSGTKLENLVIYVNNKRYTSQSSQVQVEGDPLNYTIIIEDNFELPENEASYLYVTVTDNAKNQRVGGITFNIPEKSNNEGENHQDKPDDVLVLPGDVELPLDSQISRAEDFIAELLPESLKPVIEEAGILGLISIVLGTLAFSGIVALAISFIAGFLPYITEVIFGKNRKFSVIVDDESRNGIFNVKVKIYSKLTGNIIKKIKTTFSGRFFAKLDAGVYRFVLENKNYIKSEVEITLDQRGYMEKTIVLTKLDEEDVSTQFQLRVFKVDVKTITFYLAVIFSMLNVLYTRTLISFLILVIIVFFGIFFNPAMKKTFRL